MNKESIVFLLIKVSKILENQMEKEYQKNGYTKNLSNIISKNIMICDSIRSRGFNLY